MYYFFYLGKIIAFLVLKVKRQSFVNVGIQVWVKLPYQGEEY